MKGLIGKLVILVLILIVVSGCIVGPCDDNDNAMDFIFDFFPEEDNHTDGLNALICLMEDIEDFMDFGDGEDNYDVGEPTYLYKFKADISITEDGGWGSIEGIEPSYYLTLNTENCGSLIYSGTPLIQSDSIYAESGNFTTKNYMSSWSIYFTFLDVLPVSCGDSADGTWTIIVDHPSYTAVSYAYDFTLFYWKPGSNPMLVNTQNSGGVEIYLQLEAE